MKLDEFLTISTKATVAIPFPDDEAILSTLSCAAAQGWAEFLFIGDRRRIEAAAEQNEIASENFRIEESADELEACRKTAAALAEGRAQVAMKGQVHTGEFSRTLFSAEFGLLEENRLVSHLALCDSPAYHKVLFLTDCGINIRPGFEEKRKILDNAIEMALRLGVCDPKVGLIAPVETVKEKIESTLHAARLKKEYRTFPEAVLDGPFGLDVALSAEAARIKKIESPIAGEVDILLFPELTAGNVAYKALTVLGGATIAGVLCGLTNPVVVTSRSDNEKTKLLSLKLGIALAAEMGVCG